MTDTPDNPNISTQVAKDYFVDRESEIFDPLPPMPSSLMLELSNACNHKCVFCANPHMRRRRSYMDAPFVHRILAEAADLGVTQVGFHTTGDPFMHKGLADFVAKARDLGIGYRYISTNGALATPDRMRGLIDAGINSIKFSINAGSRETYRMIHGHDDWDKVLANLQFLSQYRTTLADPPKLFVTCILTRQIEGEMNAFKALFEPLVDEIFYTPCGNQSGQMSETQALLGYPENFNPNAAAEVCALPFNRLHVTAEGYLTICCVDYQNYLTVADLADLSLRDAWHSPAAQDIRRRHLERKLEGTLCGNCWLGRKDKIEPLVAELSDPFDFDDLYKSQTERTLDRLKSGNQEDQK